MEKEIKDLEEAVEKIQERLAELKEIGKTETPTRWRAEKSDELEDQIVEVSQTATKIEKKEYKRWRAEYGEGYFYLNDDYFIESRLDTTIANDNRRYETGNYFETRKQAEQKIELLKIEQQLKDIALRLNNGVEIDWKNDKQWKYYIYYDFYYNKIEDDCFAITKHQGTIYCLDGNFKDTAITEIGEERLKNYLKEC